MTLSSGEAAVATPASERQTNPFKVILSTKPEKKATVLKLSDLYSSQTHSSGALMSCFVCLFASQIAKNRLRLANSNTLQARIEQK